MKELDATKTSSYDDYLPVYHSEIVVKSPTRDAKFTHNQMTLSLQMSARSIENVIQKKTSLRSFH